MGIPGQVFGAVVPVNRQSGNFYDPSGNQLNGCPRRTGTGFPPGYRTIYAAFFFFYVSPALVRTFRLFFFPPPPPRRATFENRFRTVVTGCIAEAVVAP